MQSNKLKESFKLIWNVIKDKGMNKCLKCNKNYQLNSKNNKDKKVGCRICGIYYDIVKYIDNFVVSNLELKAQWDI